MLTLSDLQSYLKDKLLTVNVGTPYDPTPFKLPSPTIRPSQTPVSDAAVLREIPGELSKQIGQPALRAYGAMGAFLANKIGLASSPEFTPEGDFQNDLFGTDRPISFRSVGAEFPGVPKGGAIAPFLGVASSLVDLVPGGRGFQTAIKVIAESKDVGFIFKTLKNLGIADKEAALLAPRLVELTDPLKVKAELDPVLAPLKERGFTQTVRESKITKPEVLQGLKDTKGYKPLTNAETVKQADELIRTNTQEALRIARTGKTAFANTVGEKLIVAAQDSGDFERAIDLVETISKRVTTQGQAIQALSLFNKLSPEGVLRFTQRQLDIANEARPNLNLKLTEDASKALIEQARKAQVLPEGRVKTIETAKLVAQIQDLIPATLAKKVSTFQTFAQLLNPKTAIRNLVGNLGFAGLENMSDVIASPIDSALSLITGRRSTALPSLGTQFKGMQQGFREGIQDVRHNIDTYGVPTQFDIPKTGVFKGGVGRALEKFLNYELRVPDRAFYKAAYDGSLYQQMKAAGVSTPTEAMMEIAHHDALYRTFQDDSLVAKAFVGIKRALNLGKEFGIGDIVLKYPKTPGNLLARGIEYSPAGIVEMLFHATRPMMGKPFNQRAFVQAFSRAITGTTALIGSGAFLHHLGIITGRKNKDKDVNALERTTGLGQYRINTSAMLRFVMSGFDASEAKIKPEDTLVSYDWFQPQAVPLSIGANLDEGLTNNSITSATEAALSSLAEGVNTLAEQPLVSGVKRILNPQQGSGVISEFFKSVPSSFVPTILSQINQLIDNTQRNTYSPDVAQYAINLAKNKVPGLAQTLPPAVDVYGKNLERYQGSGNNPFNVFFNPAFVSHYTPTPESQMVLDLMKQTGETTQFPRLVNYTVSVNGENKKLTPTQIVALQRYIGEKTKNLFHNLAGNTQFQRGDPEEKVKYLSNLLSDIGTAGKIVILGHRPKTVPKRVQQILSQ